MPGQPWQRPDLAAELQLGLVEVVGIEVDVSSGPSELPWPHPALQPLDVGRQCVGREGAREHGEKTGTQLRRHSVESHWRPSGLCLGAYHTVGG